MISFCDSCMYAEPQGHYHGNIELLYSTPSSVKGAGLSSVTVELPRDSVMTVWEKAERNVKGEGGQQKVKETFFGMISDVVNNGIGLQLKVSGEWRSIILFSF